MLNLKDNPYPLLHNMNFNYYDSERIRSENGEWKLSEVAIVDDKVGTLFHTLIKPSFNVHPDWTYSRISKERLFETGMDFEITLEILEFYLVNKNVVGWYLEGEKKYISNILSKANSLHCAMKRFDPYRGIYNFKRGNYHYTKLCDALKFIGKDFKGGGHHYAIDDCNATKDVWQWMNQNPITGIITGGQYAQKK